MTDITNYHALIVTFVAPTNNRGSRTKIASPRFEKSKTISYDHEFNNTLEHAVHWLRANGFVIVGTAEGPRNSYIVLSTTFRNFVDAKREMVKP